MFGGGAKAAAKKVSITVDGKVIESDEKAVNLRKELMKNNIDVYPLRAKLTGNCGGAGICGEIIFNWLLNVSYKSFVFNQVLVQ